MAREAVRKSLVLLKNQGVLPLKPRGRLLVAGQGADDIARQSGGWTLTWQGTGLENDLFPGATSIYAGLNQAVEAAGGNAVLSPDGSYTTKPDAAVVVFGEKPYAEFQGDRATLAPDPELTDPYETMRKLKAEGIPVIALMITGRPLYVNPALNTADAFVVAWLPGSEGGGIADVLLGDTNGRARYDFSGKLPADWPRTAAMADGALFEYGYGLTYDSPQTAWSALPELDASQLAGDSRLWFSAGVPAARWSLLVEGDGSGEQTRITCRPRRSPGRSCPRDGGELSGPGRCPALHDFGRPGICPVAKLRTGRSRQGNQRGHTLARHDSRLGCTEQRHAGFHRTGQPRAREP